MEPEPLDPVTFFQGTGYDPDLNRIKDLGDGTCVLVHRLLFHWTLLHCDNKVLLGPLNKWCYETLEGALEALENFPMNPPAGYEPEGWHKHPYTGRLR